MEDTYARALQNSTYQKKHDKERKLRAGKCIDELGQGDKLLIKNLTPSGGPGKFKLYWKPEIAEIVIRYKNDLTYKIKFKSNPNKSSSHSQHLNAC